MSGWDFSKPLISVHIFSIVAICNDLKTLNVSLEGFNAAVSHRSTSALPVRSQASYRRPEDVGNGQVMVSKLVLRMSPGRWLLIVWTS